MNAMQKTAIAIATATLMASFGGAIAADTAAESDFTLLSDSGNGMIRIHKDDPRQYVLADGETVTLQTEYLLMMNEGKEHVLTPEALQKASELYTETVEPALDAGLTEFFGSVTSAQFCHIRQEGAIADVAPEVMDAVTKGTAALNEARRAMKFDILNTDAVLGEGAVKWINSSNSGFTTSLYNDVLECPELIPL